MYFYIITDAKLNIFLETHPTLLVRRHCGMNTIMQSFFSLHNYFLTHQVTTHFP